MNKLICLVFTEGTVIMHKDGKDKSASERVEQVKKRHPSVKDYPSYIPIGHAAETLRQWANDGITVNYLTSRKTDSEVRDILQVLRSHKFPEGQLYYREEDETYRDVVKRARPDIFIEDDCSSIGGTDEMTYANQQEAAYDGIKQIVVPEFEGIDNITF